MNDLSMQNYEKKVVHKASATAVSAKKKGYRTIGIFLKNDVGSFKKRVLMTTKKDGVMTPHL